MSVLREHLPSLSKEDLIKEFSDRVNYDSAMYIDSKIVRRKRKEKERLRAEILRRISLGEAYPVKINVTIKGEESRTGLVYTATCDEYPVYCTRTTAEAAYEGIKDAVEGYILASMDLQFQRVED